jgi:hypothetical protein
MRQKSGPDGSAEKHVKEIRWKTRLTCSPKNPSFEAGVFA